MTLATWTPWLERVGVPDAKPAAGLAQPTFAVAAVQCKGHELSDVCRYQVAWSINPHMVIGAVDFTVAAQQHAALIQAIEGTGVAVEHMPFVHGAYDSVFMKDPALLLAHRGRKQALLARMRHPERQLECIERARVLVQQGYEVVAGCPTEWEGGDIVMLPSCEGMFLGYGLRSRRAASTWLERHAGIPVWPLELRDPHLYHLDTALAVLPDGSALVCPEALTADSLQLLERTPGIARVVSVSRDLALGFGLNLVTIGRTVLVGAHQPEIERLLATLGYQCRVVPLGQFHLAGGSAACLVARVHRSFEGR